MNFKAIALILSASSLFYWMRKKKKVLPKKKRKFNTPYVDKQLIVLFKDLGEKRNTECKKLQSKVFADLKEAGGKQIDACGKCDGLLTLWEFDDVEECLNSVGETQPSGSVSVVRAGEEDIAYLQLNFITELPLDNQRSKCDGFKLEGAEKKPGPLIAVLDTGIDTNIFPTEYLWNYGDGVGEDPCFDQHKFGHDFATSNGSVEDDDPGRHGTLINAYILEQFKDSDTYPRLMNIKVLDAQGHGTFYNFICGVLFAKSHGAQIINASLGYYDYEQKSGTNLELDYLLNTLLKEKGTLFVSAAGNETDDTEFQNSNPSGNPRNLNEHRFNFASINNASGDSHTNIIAVTTVDVDEGKVSPTQNYSSKHVDLGVQADKVIKDKDVNKDRYVFRLPFPHLNPNGYVSGSSFATAIATGRIGATLPISVYAGRMEKKHIIEPIESNSNIDHASNGLGNYVYKGRYIKR